MNLPRRKIGDFNVPVLSLGTAGWGAALDRPTAHSIADAALDLGVNLFDTAEGYPAPMQVETHGQSEHFIGQWLKQGARDRALICSKVYGPSRHFRQGRASLLAPKEIAVALDGSLERLGTDYIDLYLIHWPDSADYDAFLGGAAADRLMEQVHAMGQAVEGGKVRAWGLSNASRDAFEDYSVAAVAVGGPGPSIVQNHFSLWADPHNVAANPLPLMAYGALNHGRVSPDSLAPAVSFVVNQPFTRTCCVGTANAHHLGELVSLASMVA